MNVSFNNHPLLFFVLLLLAMVVAAKGVDATRSRLSSNNNKYIIYIYSLIVCRSMPYHTRNYAVSSYNRRWKNI